MLVFAAITPHTPLLLPTQSNNQKKLQPTIAAFEELKKSFNEAKVDTIIIFSPHGPTLPNTHIINMCDKYKSDLKEFGDIVTKPSFLPDHALVDKIQRHVRQTTTSLTLLTCSKLDYATTIPLALLTDPNKPPKIVPIGQSEENHKAHFAFGELLGDIIAESPKRIAVIASSHFSHRISSESPDGFSPEGKEYSDLMHEALKAGNVSRVVGIDKDLVEKADQCGLRSILILLGILSDRPHTPQVFDYNDSLGVGYITMQFKI